MATQPVETEDDGVPDRDDTKSDSLGVTLDGQVSDDIVIDKSASDRSAINCSNRDRYILEDTR